MPRRAVIGGMMTVFRRSILESWRVLSYRAVLEGRELCL